jgi:hypothetical protein
VVGGADVVDGLGVVVAVAAVLAEAGAVVAVTEESIGAARVVVVARVSGFFPEPPIAKAIMMTTTPATITQAHHCV